MVDFGGNAQDALIALCAALFSIVVYSTGASFLGIPTSESHSLIAGLTGAAIAISGGLDGVNFQEWAKVLYGLVLSLALGLCERLGALQDSHACVPEHGQAPDAALLQVGADSRRGGDELYARRAGRAEIHRRALPRPGLLQRAERRRQYADTRLADAHVLPRHGPWARAWAARRSLNPWVWTWSSSRNTRASPPTSPRPSACCSQACSAYPFPPRTPRPAPSWASARVKRISAINFGVVREMILTWVFTFPGCGLISFVVAKAFLLFF